MEILLTLWRYKTPIAFGALSLFLIITQGISHYRAYRLVQAQTHATQLQGQLDINAARHAAIVTGFEKQKENADARQKVREEALGAIAAARKDTGGDDRMAPGLAAGYRRVYDAAKTRGLVHDSRQLADLPGAE